MIDMEGSDDNLLDNNFMMDGHFYCNDYLHKRSAEENVILIINNKVLVLSVRTIN